MSAENRDERKTEQKTEQRSAARSSPKERAAERKTEQRIWIQEVRKYSLEEMRSGKYQKILQLNEDYISHSTPDKIKIELREHQKRTLSAMVDLETKRFIRVDLDDVLQFDQITDAVIETSAGVLSEKPGAGKTLEILSLIAVKGNNVKLTPEISCLVGFENAIKTRKRYNSTPVWRGFNNEIKRRYKKIIKSTLIFVGRTVMEQWKESIENLTKFTYLSIENIRDMRYFDEVLTKRPAELSSYDIILVKNGTITGTFKPDSLKNSHIYNKPTKGMVSVFGEICKDVCFSRVVLDDFDLLGVSSDSLTIPSIFTWFISSTKQPADKKKAKVNPITVDDSIFKNRQAYTTAWKNLELFSIFNIAGSEDFVDASCAATVIEYRTYIIDVQGDDYLKLMQNMGEVGMEAQHLINAGAIERSAKNLGIKEDENLLMQIFGKLIDLKWDEYRKCCKILLFIDKVNKFVKEELTIVSEDEYEYTERMLTKIKNIVVKKQSMRSIKKVLMHDTALLRELLEDLEKENTDKRKNSETVIARVKESLKEGECIIDSEPLAGRDVVIRKCCGKALAKTSMEEWAQVGDTCPNCRAKLKPNDYIILDRTIEHKNVIENYVMSSSSSSSSSDEEPTEIIVEEDEDDAFLNINPVQAAKDKQISELKDVNKINAVLWLLLGMEDKLQPNKADDYCKKVEGIIHGNADIEYKQEKIIVYNDTNAFMSELIPKLLNLNIAFAELKGSKTQLANIIKRYNYPPTSPEAINVLLINGPKFCAGSDLYITDAIIFTHKMNNSNTERQVAGRGARIGRKRNLRIYRIVHPNEKDNLSTLPVDE